MKKLLLFSSFYLIQAFCSLNAQTIPPEKINFIEGQSWAKVKEKAAAENKYIFLDAFTTWCVPCMKMDKEVFTQKKVGDFFNEHFISLKVQMNVTENDSDETKRWYTDAKAISTQYNIDSYPTYLFFNPRGELVHRKNGSTESADEFIDVAAAAKGTYTLQKLNFERGKRDPESLLVLLKSAQLINDRTFITRVSNAYLATQKNLLTEDNIKLIGIATKKTTDPGFSIFLSNPDKIDSVFGSAYSKIISRTILFDEIALPYIRTEPTIKDYGGGMVVYGGKLKDAVNWLSLSSELDLKYPELAKSVVIFSKLQYYESLTDWSNFTKTVSENEVFLDGFDLNRCANSVFMQCEDASNIKMALAWCQKLKENGANYLSTYANLLYKSGEPKKAISVYEGLIKSNGDSLGEWSKTMEKMRRGEKTW